MSEIVLRPIGIVHSPIKSGDVAPRQSIWSDIEGEIEIFPEFAEGLDGLGELDRIIVVFQFDRSDNYSLKVTPPHRNTPCGVFASRAPRRPNQIGLSPLEVLSVKGNKIRVRGLDILDGTPVLDIKPDIPADFSRRSR